MNIVIDMGGTNTRIGFSNNADKLDKIERYKTPQSISESHELFEHISSNTPDIKSVIFGIAGTVDYSKNRVVSATNISWIKDMTAQEITGINNSEIKTYNDAELAGLAEAYHPYATDYERVAYITISTGVGGTLIKNKKAATAKYNFEPGHIIIDRLSSIEDPADHTQGSFENLCSGTAFFKRNKVKPENCLDGQMWEKYGETLASGLYTVTLLWQPDLIILGGSMTNQWNLFYRECAQRFDSYPNYYLKPDIIKSELDDTNGLLGGLKLLASN